MYVARGIKYFSGIGVAEFEMESGSCLLYTSVERSFDFLKTAGAHFLVGIEMPQDCTREPVSYTHLDVYKRQVANCTNIFADKVAGMPNVVLKMQGEDLSQAGWILMSVPR